jgi:hypothetical protein
MAFLPWGLETHPIIGDNIDETEKCDWFATEYKSMKTI